MRSNASVGEVANSPLVHLQRSRLRSSQSSGSSGHSSQSIFLQCNLETLGITVCILQFQHCCLHAAWPLHLIFTLKQESQVFRTFSPMPENQPHSARKETLLGSRRLSSFPTANLSSNTVCTASFLLIGSSRANLEPEQGRRRDYVWRKQLSRETVRTASG